MSDVLGVTDPRRVPLLGGYPADARTVGGGARGSVAGTRRTLDAVGSVTITGGGSSVSGAADRPDSGQPDRIRQ